jgi:hypothetical protein
LPAGTCGRRGVGGWVGGPVVRCWAIVVGGQGEADRREGLLGPWQLTGTLPRLRVRRKRMPQALQSTGLPLGPLRHWGELTAPQWQQGPCTSRRRFLQAEGQGER